MPVQESVRYSTVSFYDIFIKKHSTQNIDNVDVTNPTDNETNHQFINEVDFSDVSLNLNNGEITPKLKVSNNRSIINNVITEENKAPGISYFTGSAYNKSITLTPESEEDILNIGDTLLYSSSVDVRDYVNTDILLSNTNNRGYTNNLINTEKGFDAFIINKNHKSFVDLESLNYKNFPIKDFNFKGSDSTDFIRNQYGEIKDFDSEFNSQSFLFAPYCSNFNFFKTPNCVLRQNNNTAEFNEDKQFTTDKNGNQIEIQAKRLTKLFVDFQNIPLPSYTSPTATLSKDFGNNDNFSFRAGVHDIGYVDKDGYDEHSPLYNVYVGSKMKIFSDFLLGDSDMSHVYNNISRPLIFRKYTPEERDAETNEITVEESIGESILPVVAQSYKFDRDYIIQKIKPHFIFPSALPKEYSEKRGKIKMLVTAGFLIDGKVNENGFVTTTGFSNWEQISKALENGINFGYPIFIPKGKEFFIGISLYYDKDNADFKIKCLENGKYDKSGNLISFPSNVETKMFTNGEVYTNRLLKIDLYVNVYKTDDKCSIKLNIEGVTNNLTSDRAMLFSTDFYPTNTILNYSVFDGEENQPIYIKKNDEMIFDVRKSLLPYIYVDMSTNDKYVSPIVNLNGLNLVNKIYQPDKNVKKSITSKTEYIEGKYSTLKFVIDNISCWHGNYDYQSKRRNILNTYNIPIYERNYIDLYFYLLRVDFDFHLNYYGYNVEQIATALIDINAINKVTGEKFKIFSGDLVNNYFSNIDNNRIDVVDLEENGWKRANCEHILMWLADPNSYEYAKGQKNVVHANLYPFIHYADQFKFEVSIHIANSSESIIGVEGVKNIICSLDTVVASTIPINNSNIK